MIPFTLATAAAADLPAILDLFRTAVRTVNARDYGPAQIEMWAAAADRPEPWLARLGEQYFLLASQAGRLAGFASLSAGGYLDLMYVHPDFLGQGVATLLMGRLVHHAFSQGMGTLSSDVSITARPFFTANGFETLQAQEKEVKGVVFVNYRMARPLPAPVISTGRLLLKPFGPEDAWGFYLLNSDPEVLQHTGDEPFSDWRAAARFIREYDPYSRFGYGRWTILDRANGNYLGWCGLKHHPDAGETDLGFRLHRDCWNKGYATEAARACLDYGFGPLGLNRIVGRARAANTASIRVLEKCGMRFLQSWDFEGHPGVYYEKERR